MTLASSTLNVEIGPRSVGIARRWVADACLNIGRADLADCARLGVSELVTNALVHGEPPITVAVRGTVEHPRIEVIDGSPRPPIVPTTSDDLSTGGRGLSIVAKCSTAWGADVENSRKIVWFEPASEVSPHVEPPYSLTLNAAPVVATESSDLIPVRILGADATTCYSLLRHYRELRRELRLLSLTHAEDYPLAKRLSDLIIAFEQEFPQTAITQLEDALESGQASLDIEVEASPALVGLIPQMLEVLDLADAFSRAQQFLALARTHHQNSYSHWFLGEFSRQADGEAPRTWADAAALYAQDSQSAS